MSETSPNLVTEVNAYSNNNISNNTNGDIESQDSTFEKGKNVNNETSIATEGSDESKKNNVSDTALPKMGPVRRLKNFLKSHMWLVHGLWFWFFTAWWISIVAQDKHRHKWLIPTILWLFLLVRYITLYFKAALVLRVAKWIWDRTIIVIVSFIPEKLKLPGAALGTIGVMLLGTFVPKETNDSKRGDRAISFVGIILALLFLYLTSQNRSRIRWHTVIVGQLMQFIIALFVLRTKAGYDIFNFISTLARELLGFAKDGVAFVSSSTVSQLGMFFFTVLPAVIFFIAFIYIWYYFGVIQWAVKKFAYFFFWTMRVSGAEAVVAAASPFIGQGESAILIKNFIPFLTRAEIHQVMCSGFATIAGSVLVSYIGMGLNPQALVSSCVMSIPCSLAVSKMRVPETEESMTSGQVIIPEENDDESHKAQNVLQAFANGAWMGLIIAATILTNQMCIIALVALIDGLLGWFGRFWNISNLSLQLIFGYIFYPVAFFLGAPRDELLHISRLIAIKVVQNEYNAFNTLVTVAPYNQMSKRATMLATYALCGFANFGSVGTQIGVLGQLAPKRSSVISSLVISALITGCLATLMSAAIAGMVINDLSTFELTADSSAFSG